MLWKLRLSLCALTLIVLLHPRQLLAQNTINVGPGQTYTTIQSGINAANNGDTVLVAPGTYNENIDFMGKAITVTSSGGAAVTTINGGSKGGMATVVFQTEEPSTSVLSNFTITGGGDTIFDGATDGGVYVGGNSSYMNAASPTIENNIITANYCHNIDAEASTPTIRNNEISNVLQDPQGTQGESYCSFGSGINLQGTPYYSAVKGPTVTGNTIENNLTGSGINLWAVQYAVITNNIVRNNVSSSPGSAFISTNSSYTVLVQNLIYDNTSDCGGAIAFSDPIILIANNTIVDNVTQQTGGASNCIAISQIYPNPYSYGTGNNTEFIINNIISGSTSYPAVNCSWYDPPSTLDQPTFENNILYNASGPFFGSYCIDVSQQDNNIVADPQFVSPSTGNYRLQSTSPAIDTGLNSVLQTYLSMAGMPLSTDFAGNPRVQAATSKGCVIDMGAYEYAGTPCTTTETLQSSLNPSTVGQTVTFTAQLTSISGVPTGEVQFTDGTTVLATEPISNAGVSTFSTNQLSVGSHTITATYQPTGVFTATSASLTQVVNGATTTTTLTCSPSTIIVGGTSLLSAAVSSSSGTPTGSITFTDGATTLGQPSLANGLAGLTFAGLTTGNHNIVATYAPSSSDFSTSSASCAVTVNGLPTTTTVAVTPNPSTYGQPVVFSAHVAPVAPNRGVPTGTVTFLYCRGAEYSVTLDANGNGSYISPTGAEVAEPVSSCAFVGQYSGDPTFAPSTSAPVNYVVTPSPSTTTLSAQPNPAYATQPVVFTVQISGNPSPTANPVTGNPVPPGALQFNGTVQLFDGGAQIASTTATSAQTTFTISTLSVGSHIITAAYSNDPNLGSSTSSPLTEVITPAPPGDFTLTGPSSFSFPDLHPGSAILTLTSLNNFAGTIALTCNPPLPSGYSCTLKPASTALAADGTSNTTLTLVPTTVAGMRRRDNRTILFASLFPLTLFSLLGLTRRCRTTVHTLLCLALLAIVAASTTACGPDHFIPITTGTYPITVTATGTNQGSSTPITHTTTINATIAP